jgi:hypothetical protein
MSSRAKRNKNSEHQAISTQAASEFPVSDSPSHEEISHRAYEIYIERGKQRGNDLDDWLQAELELGQLALLIRTATGAKQEE